MFRNCFCSVDRGLRDGSTYFVFSVCLCVRIIFMYVYEMYVITIGISGVCWHDILNKVYLLKSATITDSYNTFQNNSRYCTAAAKLVYKCTWYAWSNLRKRVNCSLYIWHIFQRKPFREQNYTPIYCTDLSFV